MLFQELEEQPQYQHLVAVDPLQSEESAENKHEENLVQPPPPPPAPSAASQEMPTPVQFKLPLTLDFDDLAGVSESSPSGLLGQSAVTLIIQSLTVLFRNKIRTKGSDALFTQN